MDRPALFRSAELARGAMDAATIAASFNRISPSKAELYASRAEEALRAALATLEAARRGPPPPACAAMVPAQGLAA